MGSPAPFVACLAILGIAANIVALIGCLSPTVKDVSLYRVNVTLLANGLQSIALTDSHNKTDVPRSSELPTYWYWGLSGICDVYEATGETRCRRAFPPTENLLGIVEDSLRDRLGSDQEQLVNTVVSSWNATLNKISRSRLAAKEDQFVAESKASAALAVAAIGLDVVTVVLALCFRTRRDGSDRRSTYLVPFLSALMTVAAAVLALLSRRDGVHGVVSTGDNVGPAIIVLFVGGILRVLSCGGASVSSSGGGHHPVSTPGHVRPGDYQPGSWSRPPPVINSRTPEARRREIGFRGENYVYKWLQGLPGWSHQNWTSKLRSDGGHPDFTGNEYFYADFTYQDRSGRMRQVLGNAGVPLSPQWSTATTYHLEVKATPAGCDTPLFVSENQVRLMSQYADQPSNAYILVRVFHVEGVPQMKFFLDPLSHPGLRWGPLGSDGYYPVYTGSY